MGSAEIVFRFLLTLKYFQVTKPADINHGNSTLITLCFQMTGWNNPLPIGLSIGNPVGKGSCASADAE